MLYYQVKVVNKLFTMSGKRHRDNLKFEFPELEGETRIQELILYIAAKCADDPTFGKTKLNKILFFSDFISFGQRGEAITGVAYQKFPKGPVPKCMDSVSKQMEKAKDIAIAKEPVRDFQRERVIPLRNSNLKKFSAEDIAIVDRVVDVLWGVTATEVSEISHKRAWKIAADRELIPYDAALISDEALTDYEINRTRELARQYGWGS